MEKVAVLADIHGNLAALHALVADLEQWSPDLVVVAGDVVNRGPQSGPCLDLILRLVAERGWQLIRGNHERYVVSYDHERHHPNAAHDDVHRQFSRIIAWTHAQVAAHVATVAALPTHLQLDVAGAKLVVYHASVRHDRDGLYAKTDAATLTQQIDPTATIFCAGHTHMPFVRQLAATLVVNVGSVGLPFDGDRRAAYARLTRNADGWQATLMRLPYDFAATEHAFRHSGMFDAIGAYGPLLLREIETGRSLLFSFIPTYHPQVLAGTLSLEAAVHAFLMQFDQA